MIAARSTTFLAGVLFAAPSFAQGSTAALPPIGSAGAAGTAAPPPQSAAPPPAAAQPAPAAPPQQAAPPPQGSPPPGYYPPGYYPPPPGYYPPPPGYAPQYAYPAQQYTAPPVLPYREGRPIPVGYHPEDRIRVGPFVTGLAIGGGAYVVGLAAASSYDFSNEAGWLFLPVAGPWITMASRTEYCDTYDSYSGSSYSSACDRSDGMDLMLTIDGLMQGAGAILVVIGLAVPRTVLVRDEPGTATLVPMKLGKDGHGLGVAGSF